MRSKYQKERNKIRYGNNNTILFCFLKQRGICEKCNLETKTGLTVHHKDGDIMNNNLSNLSVLCQECHKKEHFKIKK